MRSEIRDMEWIWYLLIGLAAGWLIGLWVERSFRWWFSDLIVGTIGAVVGRFVSGLADMLVGGLVWRSVAAVVLVFLWSIGATLGAAGLVLLWKWMRALVTWIWAFVRRRPNSTPHPTEAIRVCDKIVRKGGAKLATILQLSDLHLLAKTPLTDGRRGNFLTDLVRALEVQKEQFDLVIVTGDLIDASEWWPGRWRRAYANALEAILEVCKFVNVDPKQGLLIIPGNHDVRFSGIYPLPMLEQAFRDTCGPYFAHSYYPGLGLLVACFDSNEQVRHTFFDFAKGWASTEQCDTVMNGLKALPPTHQKGAARAFRLALIHHHLMAIPSDDRAADRKVVGAPSLMLLRNAGSFLHRLLRDHYRLVLHGHLHTDGYWLPQTFLSNDTSPRWLELISCPWSGVTGGPNNKQAFNVVKIHDTGVVKSHRAEFLENWTDLQPIKQEMAGYNLVRTRSWDLRERGDDSRVCDTYSQRWDVILPAGDVIITEVFRGLRREGGPLETMEVSKAALALTQVTFSAEYLGRRRGPIDYEVSAVPLPGAEDPEIVFLLKLDPEMTRNAGDKVDILLRTTVLGGIASSLEDQKFARVGPRTRGKEEIYYQAWRTACSRLVMNVRFFSFGPDEPQASLVPETMDLRVYDPDVRIEPYEQGSDHITWDFWSRDREVRSHYNLPSVPEATLSVYRPQIGYGYALEWKLPDQEPILERQSLQIQRKTLFQVDQSPTALAAAQRFLAALKEYVRSGFPARNPITAIWDDPGLGVYLYAFDESTGELVKKCQETFHTDQFPERIVYGRDLIGTAFRSWYPCSTPSPQAGSSPPLFNRVSKERAKCLFAWPLWRAEWTNHDPIDIAPVGVVALVSDEEGSGLGYILRHADAIQELHPQIATLWYKCQLEAGWAAPAETGSRADAPESPPSPPV
jgi:uncharacterized membrane protein YeaQ/YmgE (transglycosylase-associated protein family)